MRAVLEARNVHRNRELLGDVAWWRQTVRKQGGPPVEQVRLLRCVPGEEGYDCEVELILAEPYRSEQLGAIAALWWVGGLIVAAGLAFGGGWGVKTAVEAAGEQIGSITTGLLSVGIGTWAGKEFFGSAGTGLLVGVGVWFGARMFKDRDQS